MGFPVYELAACDTVVWLSPGAGQFRSRIFGELDKLRRFGLATPVTDFSQAVEEHRPGLRVARFTFVQSGRKSVRQARFFYFLGGGRNVIPSGLHCLHLGRHQRLPMHTHSYSQ